MSKSLSFELDWIDQPATSDPVERRTWASMRISIHNRFVTRVFDKQTQAERVSIYVPVFAITSWIIRNWWFLLNETSYSERLPMYTLSLPFPQREWVHRHNLRTADPGSLLPSMYIFSTGEKVCIQWRPDPAETDQFPHMTGRFEGEGRVYLDRSDVEAGLRSFIDTVLSRCRDIAAEEVKSILTNWQAITQTTAEEAYFCTAAARMGLDVYEAGHLPSQAISILEQFADKVQSQPLVNDFFDCVDVKTVAAIWNRLETERAKFNFSSKPFPVKIKKIISEAATPHQRGYAAARYLRKELSISPEKAIGSMKRFVRDAGFTGLTLKEDENWKINKILALTGVTDDSRLIVSGAKFNVKNEQRFLEARGIYQNLFSGKGGPRLLTNAHTADQQATRAFAAELLAPADALTSYLSKYSGVISSNDVNKLANKYEVSSKVIEHQLENGMSDMYL